jgi:NNP family nitrate/nitrite transporter-like MFS transporter
MSDDANKNNSTAWIILVVYCLGTFVYQYTQYQLAPIAGQLIESLGLTGVQFSSLFTAPMVPAIFISIIFGVVVDKIGIKKSILFFMLLTAIGGMGRIYAGNYALLFTTMLLTGFGATALNVTCGKVFSTWFRRSMVPIAMGCFMSAPTVGMFVAQSTTAFLASVSTAFWIAGILTVVVLFLWLFLGKDHKAEPGAAEEIPPSIGETLKVVFGSRNMWLTAFGLFFCLGGQVACNQFLPLALASRGMDPAVAGVTASIVSAGNLVGSLFMPMIAVKAGRNKPFLLAFAVICTFGYAFGWRLPGAALYISFFIFGLCASAMMPFFFSMPVQFPEVGPKYAGTGTGLISTIELLGAILLPTYILTPICSGAEGINFNLYFILIGVVFAILFFIFLLLPELGSRAKNAEA